MGVKEFGMFALEAVEIRKTYGGVVALERGALRVKPGSVHALLGGNGAGKSTLVKVITGAVRPDSGEVRLAGVPVAFANTAEATRQGMAVVSQELSLFPDLDVLSNLFPMREPLRGLRVDRARMLELARPVLEQLGLHASPFELLGSLSLAERQLVEIARALVTNPRVLVLDEPTSALEAQSAGRLLAALRVLRERQVAVVFVSHILQEVMALCDEVTVLRDGRVALEAEPIAALDVPRIVAAMLGERGGRNESRYRTASSYTESASAVRLENIHVPGLLEGVNLTAHAGEVVGLTGIVGAGHLGVIEVIAGLRRAESGRVSLPGGVSAPKDLRRAIAAGIAYVSGDRKRVGLMLDKPIWENIAQVRAVGMARDGWRLRTSRLRDRAIEHVARVGIRTSSVDARADSLSGGNQQKVVIAKWLEAEPEVLLLDDPTRGVDVGAKAEIYAILRDLVRDGAVTLLCSTDLEELVEVCDRVIVFYQGKVCAELSGDSLTEATLLEVMNTGRSRAEPGVNDAA
jgi:ABC-type sugar transport system ATPase subunit